MPQVPGNTIPGAGGYGLYPGNLYRDRYDWIIMPRGELPHLGVTAGIGLIARNPYVSVGLGVLHGLSHVKLPLESGPDIFTGSWFREFPGLLGSLISPGGGGPGQSLTSTNPPPSIEEVGDLLMEISKTGRGYGFDIMKSRTSNGRRCPPGYRWDKKRRKCVRIRKY